jgi:hypothetical protein
MSSRRRALTTALKTAHREESRAASLFQSIARSIKDAQLHGTFLHFGTQEEGAIATVEGLMDARGVRRPALVGVTRFRAVLQGRTARLRSWRRVLEDSLDATERRVRRMAEAASGARLAGDLDAARSLEHLRDEAGSQAKWFREFLR